MGGKKREASRKYSVFVHDGMGGKRIWDDVKGESILGNRNFVDRLIGYVRGYEKVREIPRSQRYINRPSLEEIFKNTKKNKGRRNTGIAEAVGRWGYSQREVADHLGLHYSTVSRLVKEGNFKISRLKT